MTTKVRKGISFESGVAHHIDVEKNLGENFSACLNRLFTKYILNGEPKESQSSNGSNTNEIDTKILKKLIPVFAQEGLKVDLDQNEIDRIMHLFKNGA